MENSAISYLNCSIDSNLNITESSQQYITGWDYWQNIYYPQVIRESYPIYIRERSEDKGKQAFEIIKILNDKRLTKIDTVKDFIEAMDCLLKIL